MVTYLRYPDGSDALIRMDTSSRLVSPSLSAIFRSIACARKLLWSFLPIDILDQDLLELVIHRMEEDSLCEIAEQETGQAQEPQIICSLGLVSLQVGKEAK